METNFPNQERRPSPANSEIARKSLSQKLWDIDWASHFPLRPGGGEVTIEMTSWEEISRFAAQYYTAVFEEDPARSFFAFQGKKEFRERYYREAGDFFAFTADRKMIGMFIGTAQDWSTYYLRSVLILPEFQGKKLWTRFLESLLSCLGHHGVERVMVDVSPSNLPNVHALNKLGFNVTGYLASERWGALIQFVKFLSPGHEGGFLDQFCMGVRHQTKHRRQP